MTSVGPASTPGGLARHLLRCVCVHVVKKRATGATWQDLPWRRSDPVFPEGVGGEESSTRVTQAAEREVTLTPLLGPGPLIPAPLQF